MQKLTQPWILSFPAKVIFQASSWVALALFAVLGALAWFTLGEGTILVAGRPVELRVFPLVVLGGFALRTVLARQAEKIRRDGDRDSS